jgi:hypothetical protein
VSQRRCFRQARLDRLPVFARVHNTDVGDTQRIVERVQTRAELDVTIGLHDYEALDSSIVQTVVPAGMPQYK